MTTDELDRLDALHAAMTPGGMAVGPPPYFDVAIGDTPLKPSWFGHDVHAIVAIHNFYPALSAALRAARVERDRLAARLAEAEELLRRFAAIPECRIEEEGYDSWVEYHADGNDVRAAAAFLATEPAK